MGFLDAVASAGPYANNLHLAPDTLPHQQLITQLLQAGCSSWCLTSSVSALKASAALYYVFTENGPLSLPVCLCVLIAGDGTGSAGRSSLRSLSQTVHSSLYVYWLQVMGLAVLDDLVYIVYHKQSTVVSTCIDCRWWDWQCWTISST